MPFLSACFCGSMPTPPKITVWRSGRCLPYVAKLSPICAASSRVGVSTRQRVWRWPRFGRGLGEPLQDRQRERRGLAGAGLREAEQVAPREHVRDRLGLDRRWVDIAFRRDRLLRSAGSGRAPKAASGAT